MKRPIEDYETRTLALYGAKERCADEQPRLMTDGGQTTQRPILPKNHSDWPDYALRKYVVSFSRERILGELRDRIEPDKEATTDRMIVEELAAILVAIEGPDI